jgi:hypothetical protein
MSPDAGADPRDAQLVRRAAGAGAGSLTPLFSSTASVAILIGLPHRLAQAPSA